jgi:hypothetical protein
MFKFFKRNRKQQSQELQNSKSQTQKSSPTFRNYLFVDVGRLDMYFQQCLDESDRYHFLTDVNFSASIVGPQVGANFKTMERNRHFQDKIEYLLEFLEKNNLLFSSFNEYKSVDYKWLDEYREVDGKRPLFILETCIATKCRLPVKNSDNKTQAINMWVIENEKSPNDKDTIISQLLLEDGRGNVENIYMAGDSPYSVLGSLIFELRDSFENLQLSKHIPNYHPNDDPRTALLQAWDVVESYRHKFLESPIEVLSSLGSIPIKKQRIHTLYQIIHYGNEVHYQWGMYSTLGYPIFIEES